MYNLKESMVEVLHKAEWTTADKGIDKILSIWETNKASLLNMFRKYPNWNEERKMIVFSHDYERETDKEVCYSFKEWVRDTEYDNIEGFDKSGINYCSEGLYFLTQLIRHAYQTLDEDMANRLNYYFPTLKARAGQKVSKVANKYFSQIGLNKHPDYNKQFAKYSDAINPLTTTRHTCISLNPIDFLMMSNGNSWTSCHRTMQHEKDATDRREYGCYCGGAMSYLLDETSFILYTVDSSYDGGDFELQPKVTRQMYHYNEGKLIQGRLYPQSWDGGGGNAYLDIRGTVQKIIADCLGMPNMWTLSKDDLNYIGGIVTANGSSHYEDYFENSCCKYSELKDVANNESIIEIGHRSVCLECGEEFDIRQSLSCCDRELVSECADCGMLVYFRHSRHVEGSDATYCDNCTRYCRYCDTYHLLSEFNHLDDVGSVCDKCFKEHYKLCPVCGNYECASNMHTIDEQYMCRSCRDKKYVICDDCGKWIAKDVATAEAGVWGYDYYCPTCQEKRVEREKQRMERDRVREAQRAAERESSETSREEVASSLDSMDDRPIRYVTYDAVWR